MGLRGKNTSLGRQEKESCGRGGGGRGEAQEKGRDEEKGRGKGGRGRGEAQEKGRDEEEGRGKGGGGRGEAQEKGRDEEEEAEPAPKTTKAAAKKAVKDDRDPDDFYPGDRVSAWYHKDKAWYEAILLYKKEDGVWDVS